MIKMRCIYCGAIFDLNDISKPMGVPGFVYVVDNCPTCKEGMDDWYERVTESEMERALRLSRENSLYGSFKEVNDDTEKDA